MRTDGLRFTVETVERKVFTGRALEPAYALIFAVWRDGVGLDAAIHTACNAFGGQSAREGKKLWRELKRLVARGEVDLARCKASILLTVPQQGPRSAVEAELAAYVRDELDRALPYDPNPA